MSTNIPRINSEILVLISLISLDESCECFKSGENFSSVELLSKIYDIFGEIFIRLVKHLHIR